MGFALAPVIDGHYPDLPAVAILGLVIDCIFALGWWLLPSSGQVREAGDKYTHQFFEAAVTLADDPTATTPAKNRGAPL